MQVQAFIQNKVMPGSSGSSYDPKSGAKASIEAKSKDIANKSEFKTKTEDYLVQLSGASKRGWTT